MAVRSLVLSVLLHLSATITYGYSIYWCSTNPDIPLKNPKGVIGGRLKYLTYLDLWIQFILFFVCLLCDLLKSETNGSLIRLRDRIFNCLAFPIGFLVVLSFWSIYAYDKELIFPTGIEKWYPFWLNHTTHSIILPILMFESYLVAHNRSQNNWSPLPLLLSAIAYDVWILYIAQTTGHWVYPVLAVLTWPLRTAFFIATGFSLLSFFYTGLLMQSLFWKSTETIKKSKKM